LNSSLPCIHILKKVQIVDVHLLSHAFREELAIAGFLEVPLRNVLFETLFRHEGLQLITMVHVLAVYRMDAISRDEDFLLA